MNEGLAIGPGATLLGIEVLLGGDQPEVGLPADRGRVWLDGESGLQLFYGKNGSGKSTVLKALADFFAGRKGDADVRGFIRINDQDREESATRFTSRGQWMANSWEEFAQMMMHQAKDNFHSQAHDFRHHPMALKHRLGDQSWVEPLLEAIGMSEDSAEWFLSTTLPSQPTLGSDETYWSLALRALSAHLLLMDYWYGDDELRELYIAGLWGVDDSAVADTSLLTGVFGEFRNSGIVSLTPTGDHTRGNWAVGLAAQMSSDTPCIRRIWDESKAVITSFVQEISPDARDSEEDLARAVALCLTALHAVGSIRSARFKNIWSLEEDLFEELRTSLFCSLENIELMFGLVPWPQHGLVTPASLMSGQLIPDGVELMDGSRPTMLPPWWPVLVDLDTTRDPDNWVEETFREIFVELDHRDRPYPYRKRHSHEFVIELNEDEKRVLDGFEGQGREVTWNGGQGDERTSTSGTDMRKHILPLRSAKNAGPLWPNREDQTNLLWTGSEAARLRGDFDEFPQLDEFSDKVSKFGGALQQIGLGLGGIRLKVEPRLSTWLDGHLVYLEVLDEPSGTWVDLDQLSEAQHRWVGHILAIGEAVDEANQAERPVVVIADEADGGVHVTASTSVLHYLSGLHGVAYASSHSPTALRTPRARLRHVYRDKGGAVAVTSAVVSGDAQASANRLGVDLLDVLATKYLAVMVEGLHDKVAIEGLFKDEPILDRTLIIEARGTKGMHAIPHAQLLVDYSDLQILVVVDNARNERFQPVIKTICSLTAAGRSPESAIRESGLGELERGATPEERTLIEIVKRAASNGSLGRLEVHGLPVKDIAMLLPPEAFGLDGTWSTYERQHAATGQGRNFKKWLKEEHGATISKKTIQSAVANLDSYNDGLSELRKALQNSFTAAEIHQATAG